MLPLTYPEFFNTFPTCIRPLGLDAALDEFEHKYGVKILLASIAGAHLWGLQTPESDIDVHGVYLKPTLKVIDLRPGDDTIQTKVDIGTDNPELEFQMFELQKFLNMLMNNNGNMLTLATSPFVIRDKNFFTPQGRYGWAKLAENFMTKEMYHYFAGYAKSQKKRALSQRGSKALVYT